MDQLDFQILTHLQEDGRRPFTEIAKALNIAEGTVRNRVAKLIADNTLQIIGLVAPQRVGLDTPALIEVGVRPGQIDRVAAEIATFPEVSYLLMVAGEYDLLVEVICRNREHLTELITGRIHQLDGVTGTKTTPILRVYKVVQPDLSLVEPAQIG